MSAAWQAYQEVKARWQTGGAFHKHFPAESQYRHSLPEEVEALTAVADQFLSRDRDGVAPSDPSVDLLLKLHRAGLIAPYVLFSLGDAGIALDYDAFRAKNREKLAEYLDQLVVPPATGSTPR